MTEATGTITTIYSGNYIYQNNVLQMINQPEGYLEPNGQGGYDYGYRLKDHIGNIRLTFVDFDHNGSIALSEITEENNYYPFGLKHKGYNDDYSSNRNAVASKFKYNGKELQDELIGSNSLDWYDYGARMYDPQIGRWHVVDPLAERRIEWSPYAYCLNNPILRFDPNGLTDFTFDKKSGEVKQVGEKNDDPDRVLKTYSTGKHKGEVKYKKDGEAKVAFGGVEKGILKDGQNFKDNDQVISVGGEGQPTVKGVEDFSLKLSGYVGTEIGGAYFTKEGSTATTNMTIGMYKNNSFDKTQGHGHTTGLRNGLKLNELTGFYHTHPSLNVSESDRTRASEADKKSRDNALKLKPSMRFFIITDPLYYGAENEKIDYTEH